MPIVYAAAMAADAVAALLSGWAYDRVGPKSLTALPIVGATVPMLAFTPATSTGCRFRCSSPWWASSSWWP
ncbi:major facilitator superfamily [Mycobacteroides abscessus subsp. abscessus]|nr:major facilitator superfamily [Mycobacteroides abscessus subsp. abscessus]